MGKYEVTLAQWKAVMGHTNKQNCDDCPLVEVSWDDAQVFIAKLNQKTGQHYRLPTEAEWEYAARGGNKSQSYTYGGSNELYRVAWFLDNSDNRAHSVGQKQPNELGLYDMSGNVTQWCADWYDAGYYANSPTQDPQGPTSGVERVSRGGYFMSPPYICAVGFRDHGPSNDRAYGIGFRLVLDP